MESYHLAWLACGKKSQYTLYSGLTRMITGHRDNRTNKAVFSIAGWRIEGLFL